MAQYRVVMDISNSQQGFKEFYLFPVDVTSTDALTKAKEICWGRTAFFADGTFLDFARISEVGPRHDGLSVQLPYPLGPHPSWSAAADAPVGDKLAPINDYKVCLQMRFETSNGQFFQRYYRFPPDTWAVNKRLPDAVRPYTEQLPAGAPMGSMTPGGGLSHLLVCQTFWRYIKENCVFRSAPKGAPVVMTPWNYSSFRKISSKKIGRPPGQLAGRRPTYS